MTVSSKNRGHLIVEEEKDVWVYCDTKELVSSNKDRDCGFCNCKQTKEGHDGCLGTLKFAMNACCGHGSTREAFVQFSKVFRISGIFAVIYIWVSNVRL